MIISIDNIAYGGYGVGKIDGKTTFVNYALPGDILDIEIYKDKKNFSFAKISGIIEPSSKRINSECPNFGVCGGCSYMNLEYSDELKYKELILTDQIKRFSLIKNDYDLKILNDNRYHYRSHSSVKCNIDVTGFYERNSNRIIPFPENGCMIISEKLNTSIKNLNKDVYEGETDLKIAENWRGIVYHNRNKNQFIEEKESEYFYNRDINGFFQSNKLLRSKMIDIVSGYSELTDKDEFVDICSGCGFFTIPLSRIASHGTGFDIDKKSILYATKNAKLNNRDNIKFYQLSETDINPFRLNPKTVIIDPPRSGISKKGRRTINTLNSEIIVYVSCNPSTFARDISDFFKNDYILEEITLIDMFPCTHHIELVGKLIKNQR